MFSENIFSNEKYELYEEGGQYFLRLEFDCEDKVAYYHGVIKKIKFSPKILNIYESKIYNEWKTTQVPMINLSLPIGFEIIPDDTGNYFTLTKTSEKIYKMTLEEIEKKLGHKVEIVG